MGAKCRECGYDLDLGGRCLSCQVARLEERVAVLRAALKLVEWQECEDGGPVLESCPACGGAKDEGWAQQRTGRPVGHAVASKWSWPATFGVDCPVGAALSDTGEGWLPPKVLEEK